MNDASIAQIFPNESDPQIIYTCCVRVCIMWPIHLSRIHVDGAYNSM